MILATLAAVVILFIITVGHKLYVEARARRLRTLTGDYESGIRSTILNARPDVKPPRTPPSLRHTVRPSSGCSPI
ncbi:MAG: hypothetical protein MZW92_71520 [Comamonadaceae bacterium]|nr:hypothetical protein [Comamonadaceae bacterium]